MVQTRNLLHHDDGKNNTKSSCYPSRYCFGITAQLEASAAAAAAAQQDHHKPKPSISLLRLTMADENLAASASPSSHVGVDAAGEDGDWLQLGLATASSSSASSSGDTSTDPAPTPVELGLFTCGYDKQHARTMRPPLFALPLRSYQYGHDRHRPTTAARESMSASFLPFLPPFRSSGDTMRVISPPRRTQVTGLWLTLQAAPNQSREPILPQIPKSYLRIKDSNMKVEVVMKYLADKLGLTQPHQVELTCRGQTLPPFLLVKYVRDNIWCPSLREEEAAALADHRRSPVLATTTDHVMTLCYYIKSRNMIDATSTKFVID